MACFRFVIWMLLRWVPFGKEETSGYIYDNWQDGTLFAVPKMILLFCKLVFLSLFRLGQLFCFLVSSERKKNCGRLSVYIEEVVKKDMEYSVSCQPI